MKKSILTINAMALCLLSCSSGGQDDAFVPEPSPTPPPTPEDPNGVCIAFGSSSDSWQDAPTTRAETTTTGLDTYYNSFRVWGYKSAGSQKVMDNYRVLHNSDNKAWEYIGMGNDDNPQTMKYWDYSATDYRFMAYAPADADGVTTDTKDDTRNIVFPYKYSDDATPTSLTYISDLWQTTDHEKYGKNVTLTFAPIIAKLRFKFLYPNDAKRISVKDIAFTATNEKATIPTSGTITVSYPLTGDNPQRSIAMTQPEEGRIVFTIPYEEKDDDIHILKGENPPYGKWYYVPPLDIAGETQGSYTITATIDGNHSTATVPAQFMQWKAGFQYTYIFKITEAGTLITFSEVKVEQWVEGANVDNNGKGTEKW